MKPKSLKTIQARWYAKLEREGFTDIERNETSETTFRRPVSTTFTKRQSVFQTGRWIVKQEYYQMAEEYSRVYPFETELEQTIWEYHANGISIRGIAKLLKKLRIRRKGKTVVGEIVKKHDTIMRSMMWMQDVDETNEQ